MCCSTALSFVYMVRDWGMEYPSKRLIFGTGVGVGVAGRGVGVAGRDVAVAAGFFVAVAAGFFVGVTGRGVGADVAVTITDSEYSPGSVPMLSHQSLLVITVSANSTAIMIRYAFPDLPICRTRFSQISSIIAFPSEKCNEGLCSERKKRISDPFGSEIRFVCLYFATSSDA